MLAQTRKSEILTELMLVDIDSTRLNVSKNTEKKIKSDLGQFFTEPRIALFMSQMFEIDEQHVKLLDPGAGIGNLTTAAITQLCKKEKKPISIDVLAVELDKNIIKYLEHTLKFCKQLCTINNISFTYTIIQEDFIDYGVSLLKNSSARTFTKVITNPPYKKINSNSKTRLALKEVNVETTNLYSAFVAIAKKLLQQGGELVAITPRSFCNGTYFKPFRADFLSDMNFRRIHLFESRTDSFKNDEVLQENIIYHAIKDGSHGEVVISSSESIEDVGTSHSLEYDKLVHPEDEDKFIRILRDESDIQIKHLMEGITCSLDDLNLKVSTGKVVDFRTTENLRSSPTEDTVPLIYPVHFNEGYLKWPIASANKPNAILQNESTKKLLVPRGNYVLVRRFSSNEEKRRIVPAICDSVSIDAENVGFENHLNYYHQNGQGLPLVLAKGLALYLSSTLVDRFFRQFNGHTQVNVGDLKSLPYPTYDQLMQLGSSIRVSFPLQEEIDRLVAAALRI